MGLLDILLGRVSCAKCGVFIPRATGQAFPVELDVFDIITEGHASSTSRRQIEANIQARRVGARLLCPPCYKAAYDAMPAVQIIKENERTMAAAQVRQLSRMITSGAPVAQIAEAGGTIDLTFANHFDAEGRLIIDQKD